MRLRKKDLGRFAYIEFLDHTQNEPIGRMWATGKLVAYDSDSVTLQTWDTLNSKHTDNDQEKWTFASKTIKKWKWLAEPGNSTGHE